jgi:hypothetical protein
MESYNQIQISNLNSSLSLISKLAFILLSFNFTLFVASVNSLRHHNHTGRTPLPEIQDFDKVLAKRRRLEEENVYFTVEGSFGEIFLELKAEKGICILQFLQFFGFLIFIQVLFLTEIKNSKA